MATTKAKKQAIDNVIKNLKAKKSKTGYKKDPALQYAIGKTATKIAIENEEKRLKEEKEKQEAARQRKQQEIHKQNQQIVDRAMRWSMPGAEKKAEKIFEDLTGYQKRGTSTSKRLSEEAKQAASGKAKEIAKSVAENDKAAKATGTKWLEEQRASGKSTISTKGAAGSTATVKSGTQSGLGYAGKTVTKDILGTVLPAAGAGKASTGTKGSTAQATGKKTGSMPYASQEQLQKEWDKLLNRKQQEYEAYQNQINQLDVAGKYGMLAGDEKSSFWKGPVNKDALQQLMSQQAKSNKPFSKDMDTLHKEKKQYQTELDEVNARIKAEQDRLAALGPKTTDELMADSEEWNKLNAYQNKISELSDHGLDITPNNALGIQGQTRIKNKPADYYDSFGNETDRSLYYDAALYDAIHGNGAYEQIYNNGTDEDFDKVNNEVEDLWKRLENGTLMDLARNGEQAKAKQDLTVQMQGSSAELQTAQAQARAIQKQLDEANREIESQRDYYAYMLQFQNPEKAGYIPENDRGGTAYGNMTELEKGVQTDDIHRIYSFINGGKEYQSWLNNSGWTKDTVPVTSEYSKTALMMPNEIDAFNNFYNQGKYDEAKAFLSALQPYLNQRYAPYESIYVQEAAKKAPISASIVSQGMKIANTYIDIPRHIAGWLGDKSVEDRNSNWYLTSRQSEEIENTIANEIGGIGGKIYTNSMNSFSNLLRGLTVPAESRLAQSVLGLGSFFLQVDQEATARYLKDHDYKEAQKLGAIDAAFELAEEFLPFETMLGTEGKGLGISMLLNSLSEAGQEFVGATLFEKIKGIITGEDSEQERVDEILYRGSYIDRNGNEVKLSEDPEVALQQARTQAGKEFWQAAAENAAAGFFGGALGGTYGTIAQATGMSRTGKAISSERNNQQGKTGLQRILELGAGMKEGTKSQEIAAKLQAKVESGKKVSDFQLGNLAQTIAEETGEQQGAVIKDTVQRVIRGQLEAKGVGREAAGTYADVIATAMVENKGKLNKAARSVLAKDQRAIDVWKSYNSAGSAEEMAASLKNQMELEKEVTKETAPQRSIMDTLGTLATDKSIVTGAMSAEVQRAVSSTKSDAEAIDYLAKNNSSLMSEEYAEEAKRLLESDPQAKQTKSFVDDVMKIRMAAMSLMETAPATNLRAETAQALFDEAKKEFEETDRLRIQRTAAREAGKGVATFDGAEYGTDSWKEKTRQFSKNVRNQMGAVALIAKQFGHEVHFINDENRNMVNGWQSEADGSITINVATGMKHSMLATVTHEMTHWLEHNSKNGYAQLRQFVVDSLRKNGVNVENMLMQTIRNQERVRTDEMERLGKSEITSLSLSDAMAELVAKSSEDILTSQAMKEAIAKANPTLFTQIKNFARNVIARIDSALAATTGLSMSAEATALRNVRDQIAGMWLEAREDALGNSAESDYTGTGKTQMSLMDNQGIRFNEQVNQYFSKKGMQSDRAFVIENSLQDAGINEEYLLMKQGVVTKALREESGSRSAHADTISENDIRATNRNIRTCEAVIKNSDGTELLLKARDGKMPIGYAVHHSEYYNNKVGEIVSIHGRENPLADFVNRFANGDYLAVYVRENGKLQQLPGTTIPSQAASMLERKLNISQNDSTGKKSYSVQDDEYAEAVERGDMRRAEEMLLEKMEQTEGIIPYRAPYFHNGDHAEIARAIKSRDPEVVKQAAEEMAVKVPDNAVLIPMPPHSGKVTEDTDTMILARAISEITGRPVITALESDEHISRNVAKTKGIRGVNKDTMGFRQVAEIPADAMPIFIDNVVGGGVTAQAAHDAIGRGITLAYAQSSRSKITGAKFLSVTRDADGNLIPLSQRLDINNPSWKYSVVEDVDSIDVKQGETLNIQNDEGNDVLTILPGNTVAATQYSVSSYFDLGERTKMMKALKKAGYSEEEIDKWMQPLTSIAVRIMSNRAMYDFVADRSKSFLKENGDVYKKTLDANTMCKKTRLYNGTFNVVQHLMPHTILMPEDLIDLYNIMKDRDLETPCGFCYVQSRRRLLGQYTEEWLKDYQGEYIPNVDEVTTSDGLEKLKIDHPQTYKDFVDAMNKKGVNNPKLVQQRTDYRGEIRKMRKSTIDYLKRIGGLRIQSFSDFETVHMLDMMQAVIDMKAMGLTAQAYTKVPEFAWIFGRTGIKINLSLVGKGTGLDANGQLVFDDSEGINSAEAFRLRDAYSKNVGTILVGINDDHIITAMGDSRIDFIIPFHKSGWSKNELEHMRGLEHYEDYTADQNEYDITGRDEEGNLITVKAESNLDPLSYWDFSKNGEYNARKYLQICKEQKIQPKFTQFLTDNGDGSWSLPEGKDQRSTNIREGYWKTLIDFKMYDNDGIGAKQELVQPNFNMEAANRILYEYDGSHRELPEDWAAAEEFVEMYKKNHPLDNVRTQYSVEQAPDMDVQRFMLGLDEHHMNTEQERVMLRQFKELRGGIDAIRFRNEEREKQIREIEAKKETSVYDREKLRSLRNIQQNEENRLARMEKELIRVTSDKGYAKLMYKTAKMMSDLVTGRSAEDVQKTVRAMNSELDNVTKEMEERAERLRTLAEKEAVLRIRQQFDRAGLKRIASALKKNTGSSIANETIENRLALIALKMKQGEFDKENTQELAELLTGGIKSDYDSYIIDALRGSTITLSPVQLKELKGQNRTLADVRRDLAGTGIRIGTKGNVTLDGKWDELCDMIPSLDRDETATNQLDALLGVIRSEKKATYTGYGTDENMMTVSTKVLEAARDLIPEIVTDEKSLKLIKETLEFVQTMSAEARGSAEAMADIGNLIGNLQKKSAAATGAAEKLTGDVKDAIEYFNELSKQSEAAIWKRERSKLIEQLKSENTMNILMEQEKWKKRIERDKTAREMRESNLQLRKRISTNYGRIRKLILAETDQQNVPEYMKSLARFMLDKITTNDLLSRKLTGFNPKDLAETKRVLDIMREQDGDFSIDDLRMIDDEEAQAAVADALADLEDGLGFYNATPGKDLISNLQAYRNSLERISDAVTTITNVINAERSLSFWNRKMDVADAAKILMEDMRRKKNRKELAGAGSKQLRGAKYTVTYGNETPVYFFKNLKNRGMDMQWEEMTHAENRNGLEVQKAKDAIGAIADKTGYKNWAGEKHKVTLGGFAREISIENMMELYAIWKREQTTNPEMSQHLNKGGVFIQDNANEEGRLRMEERKQQKAFRVTDEEIQVMYDKMTDAQKEYLDGIVSYLSNEMSALGNEASMRMYGIKKYKESYYFPMKVWDGVKSARSDKGITGTDENRAAHKSWSKRRKNMAKNALVIGNFTQDAVNHIVEMINYNTMAPAIENINKILNYQVTEGLNQDEATSRNMRVMFEEAYGRDALKYLEDLLKDMNGGAVQDQRKTLRDRALSMFKKNAVAGSASVALQQPLSYIRAAMMINPKYLARAISPNYWKGSYEEMNRHSGVAVIKDMGRFDMNFGQSAKDFITPETGKNLYGKVSDLLTKAPELMDRMTWTRMWTACKLEQKALHPEMDVNSDAFLNMVGKRFNEVMRRTQVYDSVLVKSSNMRSQNLGMKVLTSFMAEPTLSLNVLADAVRNVREKGGLETLGKAGATFMLSAICQSLVKGLMGSGRTPDDKKTWWENFLNKWYTAFLSEANPFGLVPGYSDIVELIKNGELQDDAMGAVGKIFSVIDRIGQMADGKGKGVYRDIEDTAAQLAQLFTNIPAKNLMRDARAMYNWITQEPYAKRDSSSAVIKYQTEAGFWNADTLISAINKKLGDAGFQANNKEYYSRIYNAMKNGNEREAEELREYLELGKGVKPESIDSGIKSAAKDDADMTDAEKSSWMIDKGMMNKLSDVTGQYKDGKLTKPEATKLMKQMDPEITDDEIYWKLDQIDYRNETGAEKTPTGYNYRLKDAINANKAEDIRTAIDAMLKHGFTKEKIKKDYLGDWKNEYQQADADGRRKIRDALEKAYKALGYTAEDADKVIDKWTEEKKKKDSSSKPSGIIASLVSGKGSKETQDRIMWDSLYRNTEGEAYGKGNIDLNKRQVVKNKDGSISTEKSFSFWDEDEGKEILIPTVINGKIVSEDEAIDHYYQTGEYLGKFDTWQEADEYAEKLHDRQDWYYHR